MHETSRIARLRIAFDETEPTIWLTVEVLLSASLKLLHEVIQADKPLLRVHFCSSGEPGSSRMVTAHFMIAPCLGR